MGYVNNNKSLCILIDQFIVGGLERVVLDSLKGLSSTYKVTLHIFSGTVAPTFIEEAKKYAQVVISNVRISKIKHVLLRLPHIGAQIYKRYIGKKYDILIVARDICMSAAFSKISDKTIYWCHADKDIMYSINKSLSFLRKINKLRLTILYRKCDQIWVLNDEIKDGIEKAFHPLRTEIVTNPIVCDKIISKSDADCDFALFAADAVNIILVGRLSEEKGFIRVISALYNLKSSRKVCLHIIGDGPEYDRLKSEAKNSTASFSVYFYGEQSNPYPYIKKADLLICPSYTESFGVVMLEAMLLKTPVLATSTVGARFVTQNGKYGMLVNNDDQALSQAIHRFLDDTTISDKSVSGAYEYSKKYDIHSFDQTLIKLIES